MGTAALVVAAGLATLLAARLSRPGRAPAPRWWYLAAAFLLALGCCEFLGLDRALTARLARISYEHGWYDDRRELQRPLVLLLFIGGTAGGLVALTATRRWSTPARAGLAATLYLATFTAIRLISFHNVDSLLRGAVGRWLEPAGAAMALAAALFAIDWARLRHGSRRELAIPLLLAIAAALAGATLAPRRLATAGPLDETPLAAHELMDARVTGVAEFSTGSASGPVLLPYRLPPRAEVRQAWLYWGGEHTTLRGDAHLTVDGIALSGHTVGGPSYFYSLARAVNVSVFTADVTALVAAAGTLQVDDLSFDVATDGLTLVVLYEVPGDPPVSVRLRQGLDLAYAGFGGPRHDTHEQTFHVAPAHQARVARVILVMAAVDAEEDGRRRPTVISLASSGTRSRVLDAVGGQGGAWDAEEVDVPVPAGADAISVQVQSLDAADSGLRPASFGWVAALLVLPG